MKRRALSHTMLPFAFLFLLLMCSNSISNNIITQSQPTLLTPTPEYILDQTQTQHNHDSSIHSIIRMAQSFKPTMSPLTRVELKMEKLAGITDPLIVSIRKDLTANDLSAVQIAANDVPYFSNWVEFDIPDIEVTVNETYYIVIRTNSPSGLSYYWYDMYADEHDYYPRGEQWFSNDGGGTWSKTSSFGFNIDFTFRTYSYISHTDLYCEGFLNWSEVAPGEEITGSFTVQNNGTPLSYLNWKIMNWPSWGIWTFSQSSGQNLRPEDGARTIQVTVEAPHTDIPDTYTGKILIINQDDPDDYEMIDARMVTPKSKSMSLLSQNSFAYQIIKFFYPYLSEQIPLTDLFR